MNFVSNSVVQEVVKRQPYPLIFATLSGAHLYGFPSPDSDFDVRGVHVAPLADVVGLFGHRDTIESSEAVSGVEVDLVTHDVKKFFTLLLKRNGYVLEQLYSPLVSYTTPEHEELKSVAKGCITRNHSHHYLGFADSQWALFLKEYPPRVKALLYVFRVLLTGIQLLRTGQVEANILILNDDFRLPYIPELVARKMERSEKSSLAKAERSFYESEFRRLRAELEAAHDKSCLPEEPECKDELNDLLLRIRLSSPVLENKQ